MCAHCAEKKTSSKLQNYFHPCPEATRLLVRFPTNCWVLLGNNSFHCFLPTIQKYKNKKDSCSFASGCSGGLFSLPQRREGQKWPPSTSSKQSPSGYPIKAQTANVSVVWSSSNFVFAQDFNSKGSEALRSPSPELRVSARNQKNIE